eukprot:Skav228875  [mRNA]  locus=scaffold2395:55567:55923:- [translate_table: standard]
MLCICICFSALLHYSPFKLLVGLPQLCVHALHFTQFLFNLRKPGNFTFELCCFPLKALLCFNSFLLCFLTDCASLTQGFVLTLLQLLQLLQLHLLHLFPSKCFSQDRILSFELLDKIF